MVRPHPLFSASHVSQFYPTTARGSVQELPLQHADSEAVHPGHDCLPCRHLHYRLQPRRTLPSPLGASPLIFLQVKWNWVGKRKGESLARIAPAPEASD